MENEKQATANVLPTYAENGNYVLTSMLRDCEQRLTEADEREKLAEHGETVFEKRWMVSRELCGRLLKLIISLERLIIELYPGHVEPEPEHIGEYQAVWGCVQDARIVIAEAEAHLKETP